jgi:hypothetical protein
MTGPKTRYSYLHTVIRSLKATRRRESESKLQQEDLDFFLVVRIFLFATMSILALGSYQLSVQWVLEPFLLRQSGSDMKLTTQSSISKVRIVWFSTSLPHMHACYGAKFSDFTF